MKQIRLTESQFRKLIAEAVAEEAEFNINDLLWDSILATAKDVYVNGLKPIKDRHENGWGRKDDGSEDYQDYSGLWGLYCCLIWKAQQAFLREHSDHGAVRATDTNLTENVYQAVISAGEHKAKGLYKEKFLFDPILYLENYTESKNTDPRYKYLYICYIGNASAYTKALGIKVKATIPGKEREWDVSNYEQPRPRKPQYLGELHPNDSRSRVSQQRYAGLTPKEVLFNIINRRAWYEENGRNVYANDNDFIHRNALKYFAKRWKEGDESEHAKATAKIKTKKSWNENNRESFLEIPIAINNENWNEEDYENMYANDNDNNQNNAVEYFGDGGKEEDETEYNTQPYKNAYNNNKNIMNSYNESRLYRLIKEAFEDSDNWRTDVLKGYKKSCQGDAPRRRANLNFVSPEMQQKYQELADKRDMEANELYKSASDKFNRRYRPVKYHNPDIEDWEFTPNRRWPFNTNSKGKFSKRIKMGNGGLKGYSTTPSEISGWEGVEDRLAIKDIDAFVNEKPYYDDDLGYWVDDYAPTYNKDKAKAFWKSHGFGESLMRRVTENVIRRLNEEQVPEFYDLEHYMIAKNTRIPRKPSRNSTLSAIYK